MPKTNNSESIVKEEKLIPFVKENKANPFVKQINNNRFIKRRVINKPSNNSFYQKKYNQNLSNVTNSYEASDDEKKSKVIDLNVNSSDDDSDIEFN